MFLKHMRIPSQMEHMEYYIAKKTYNNYTLEILATLKKEKKWDSDMDSNIKLRIHWLQKCSPTYYKHIYNNVLVIDVVVVYRQFFLFRV